MAKRLGLTDWRNIIRNVAESNHEEYGNEVEVMYLDNVPSPGEWALCHGEELFEDGFETEHDAEQRLEHITKVIDLEPIASICISNTCGVLIYDSESDYVLAGVNDEVPEYYEVTYELEDDEDADTVPMFKIGEWELPLGDAMRLNY